MSALIAVAVLLAIVVTWLGVVARCLHEIEQHNHPTDQETP